MKRNLFLLCFLILAGLRGMAQEVVINILPVDPSDNPNGVVQSGQTGLIKVSITNAASSQFLSTPMYSLVPMISVPTALVEILGVEGLPNGWSVCGNDGGTIFVSNGTDQIPVFTTRSFYIRYKSKGPTGGPAVVTATLGFGGRTNATKCDNGPQTDENLATTDNSTSSLTVFNYNIVKTVTDAGGNGKADPNEELTYTLKVTNISTNDVTIDAPIIIKDPLPAHTTYVSGGTFDGTNVVFTIPSMAKNASQILTFKVKTDDLVGVDTVYNLAGGNAQYYYPENPEFPTVPSTRENPAEPGKPSIEPECISGCPTKIPTSNAVLPVSLINFTATKMSGEKASVLLNWSTTREVNSSQFEVQHSTDGSTWKIIGMVAAKGSSSSLAPYNYTDANAANGKNYYRLKLVDKDKTFAYSLVVSANFGDGSLTATSTVYPNPSKGIVMIGGVDLSKISKVEIWDMNGKVVYSAKAVTAQGLNVSTLADGMYLLRATFTDGNIANHKLVISKAGNVF